MNWAERTCQWGAKHPKRAARYSQARVRARAPSDARTLVMKGLGLRAPVRGAALSAEVAAHKRVQRERAASLEPQAVSPIGREFKSLFRTAPVVRSDRVGR